MTVNYECGHVMTEGDEIYYEVRGQGQPLLMIPGGNGDAGPYTPVADILADEYQVITYDRRAYSRSTGRDPQNFEVSQQARDAVAVLRAAGHDAAFVFGSSAGALIALEMARSQPHAVRAIVAHEPPAVRVHPDHAKWQRFFAGVYRMAFRYGATIAMLRFVVGIGLTRAAFTARAPKNAQAPGEMSPEFFVKHELIPFTMYKPDVERIKQNGVKVFMAAGQTSLNERRFYAETAPILAKMLGCEMVIFPGHHISMVDQPVQWAAVLRGILHKLSAASHEVTA